MPETVALLTPEVLTTGAELDALPLLSVVLNPDGNPHAYQKRMVIIGGQRLARWFCTTDTDWPESSERLLRENRTFITLWLPGSAAQDAPRA